LGLGLFKNSAWFQLGLWVSCPTSSSDLCPNEKNEDQKDGVISVDVGVVTDLKVSFSSSRRGNSVCIGNLRLQSFSDQTTAIKTFTVQDHCGIEQVEDFS
jgi:hypothetical protein